MTTSFKRGRGLASLFALLLSAGAGAQQTITLTSGGTTASCTASSVSLGAGGSINAACISGFTCSGTGCGTGAGTGTPPTAPTSVTATAGDASINVAFSGGSLGSGTLVNYTAACGGLSNSGMASPILVSAVNGVTVTCTVTTTTSVGSATSGPSNPVTPAAASSAGCGPGELLGTGDLIWSPLTTTTLFPIPPASGSGDLGRAIKFTADGATYPKGIKLQTIDESANGLPKDVVISACPHSFVPVGGQASCYKAGTTGFYLYLRYSTSPSAPASYDCQLQAGTVYYINFRHYVTSGTWGTVSAQFGATAR